ncbi:MAG: hypothetical protein KAR25_03350 [Methanosarcinales archaeon]|nr:hypothetical protein [Methanosarcinales archaeon]
MNIPKSINYILGFFFILTAGTSYYFVTNGTININIYTLWVAISITLAIAFFQVGRSIKTEHILNALSKVPQIEKKIDEAKTTEEKIKVLEEEKEKLLEYIEIESKRMFLIKRLEDIDERLKDGYKHLTPLLNEIDILENELNQINDSYSSSISLKEIEKIRDRIEAKREGKLFLKIGGKEYEIATEYLNFYPPFLLEFTNAYIKLLNKILTWRK